MQEVILILKCLILPLLKRKQLNLLITKRGKTVYLYEPLLARESINNDVIFVNSLQELNNKSDIIVANILTEELIPYKHKVYTRDLIAEYENLKMPESM